MKDGDFGVGISLENVIVRRRMTLKSVGGAFESLHSGARKDRKKEKLQREVQQSRTGNEAHTFTYVDNTRVRTNTHTQTPTHTVC